MATEIVEVLPKVSLDRKKKNKENQMNNSKQESLATLAMMAAMADRTLTTEERATLQNIMEGLSEESRNAVYKKVFQGTGSIEEELSQLDSEELRNRGYTLVNEICQSDGSISKKERQFLARLRTSMAFSAVLESSRARTPS